MDNWKPMHTAPTGDAKTLKNGPKVDLLAKRYNPSKDEFEWKRHPDCCYAYCLDGGGFWKGLDTKGQNVYGGECSSWHIEGWLPVPGVGPRR